VPSMAVQTSDFYVSVIVMGNVVFTMVIFYVVSYPKASVQKLSWNVLNSAITMFLGALLAGSSGALVNYVVLGTGPHTFIEVVVVTGIIVLLWHTLAIGSLAYISGAIGDAPKNVGIAERNCKSFAVLFGLAMAAMNLQFWGYLQADIVHYFSPRAACGLMGVYPCPDDEGEQSPEHTVAAVAAAALVNFIAAFAMWCLFKSSALVRHYVAMSDDGEIDEYERMWMKYQDMGESQCACLTLGFLTIQLARTAITGYLPMPNGDPNPHLVQTKDAVTHITKLFITALVLATLMVLVIRFMPDFKLKRIKEWTKGTCAFACAWALLYCSIWTTFGFFDIVSTPGKLLCAFEVTVGGFLFIILLTLLQDMSALGSEGKAEIAALQMPLSTLIGFAWKATFVNSNMIVTARVTVLPAPIETMLITVVLVAVVAPAWIFYIVPIVMAMEKPNWKPAGVAPDPQKESLLS